MDKQYASSLVTGLWRHISTITHKLKDLICGNVYSLAGPSVTTKASDIEKAIAPLGEIFRVTKNDSSR
jgi:hypothetical protein